MTISIRSFRNTDAQSVCNVWEAHHAAHQVFAQLDTMRLELYSLAKPYFDPRLMLIAEQNDEVVGFLLGAPLGDGDDIDRNSIAVSSLCVPPHDDENEVARQLLERFLTIAEEGEYANCYFKPILPNSAFFLGTGPADSMAGATTADTRTRQWLSDAGYSPHTPTCLWELDLLTFKPPVDRNQIQIRRSAQVNRQLDEPTLDWWRACVLGHTEPTQFQLSGRADHKFLCEALFWSIAPELQTIPESIVWLWPPDLSSVENPDELTFLLAEALREFQNEHVSTIRTATTADDNDATTLLRRLGFDAVQNGAVYRKTL